MTSAWLSRLTAGLCITELPNYHLGELLSRARGSSKFIASVEGCHVHTGQGMGQKIVEGVRLSVLGRGSCMREANCKQPKSPNLSSVQTDFSNKFSTSYYVATLLSTLISRSGLVFIIWLLTLMNCQFPT